MPKRTSAADAAATPLRVVIVTMDSHLASAAERARTRSWRASCPGLTLTRARRRRNGATTPPRSSAAAPTSRSGDIVIATMLFMEDHFQPVLPALQARRDHCDAMVCVHVGRRGRCA